MPSGVQTRLLMAMGALSLILASAGGSARTPSGDAYDEALVKVELLERFTRFIDWPAPYLSDPTGPFVACIFGDDPIGPYMAGIARTRRFKDRRIEVRNLVEPAETTECHMVWISRSREKDIDAILGRTSGRPVLTVADTAGFGRRGVMINLFRESTNLRYEVNLCTGRKSGLTFSSKLLRLARIVCPEGEIRP